MKKRSFEFLFPLMALALLVFALSQQMFNVPPVGKLVDPFIGAIQNENDETPRKPLLAIDKMEVSEPVQVFFDDRQVPHINAANTEDLYFAQGYVTAYFRLWQMDFLSYLSAGRLSEIIKEGVLDYDRRQRRIGILDAAKASLKMIEQDPETLKILTAYTRGVNAYIRSLEYKQLPVEYKLLDYSPEPWTNLKTVLLMKHMANTLSGYEEDLMMTNLMLALGEEKFNRFFPAFKTPYSPMVSDSSAANPYLAYTYKPGYLDYSFLSSSATVSKSAYDPRLGSNSWVVSGEKTKSGHPILASDPHLSLSLPSIWLEMQLSAPGLNVYGVSIPGVPAIIIGFNENIAWGLTNGADDVKDWYKLKLTDDYTKYQFDGKWKDLEYTVEPIKRKGRSVFYDTIYHTLQGPVVSDKRFPAAQPDLVNHALKWELHQPSNEFLTFIKLNRAKDYTDYRDALKHYFSPVQNFTFASRGNDIAVTHQGRMAVKWPGQGKFILDGTSSAHLYSRYIPSDSLPHQLNPSCHYVVSANQHPTSESFPYYYNGYYSENRANRIRSLLEKENGFDLSKMQAMQLDNTNSFALDALPVLMKSIEGKKLDEPSRQALAKLSAWKGAYDPADENAELFQLWINKVRDDTWDEFRNYSFGAKLPADYVLVDLIRDDPSNEVFQKQGTAGGEQAGDVVAKALAAAVEKYNARKKEGSMQWSSINRVNIMHMLNIKQFSRMNLFAAGYPEAINATSSGFGPSWRMVVELGERPRAFGIYPGGQSGSIGSASYDEFVGDWNKGRYYPLIFFMSQAEAAAQTKYKWTISK